MGRKKIAGITIELDADTSKMVKALDKVSKNVEGIGKKITNVGTTLTRDLTVPIVTAAGVCVSKFAEVDKTMTLTNQTMQNSVEEADLLNKAMQDAAANSTFGMDDAANAALNFARAGLDAAEAAAAMAPAMNLAAGEGGDLDTVSAGLVATINGFGDEFGNAEHYADVFANACNNSALDVNSLSDAMSIAAPVFNAAGYSVQDAALYMGVMANAGIEASEAANSLKTGIARLISPAKQGAAWMMELGLMTEEGENAFVNADGTMKDSVEVHRLLYDSFSKLSESEQIAAASAIFGKNQMAKWLALVNTAPADVEKLNTSLEQEGTTTDMANAMMSGFGGSIEKLKSSLDVLMTSLGQLAAQYLVPVIEKVQGAIDAFMGLDDETKDHIIKIAGIVAAVGPVLVIIGKVVTGISSIISVASGLIAVISAISAPILIVVGVVAALVAAFVYFYNTNEEFRSKVQEIWENIKTAVTSFFEVCKQWFDQFVTWITPIVEAVSGALSAIWELVQTIVGMLFGHIQQKLEENKAFIQAALDYIKILFSTAWSIISNVVSGALKIIQSIFTTVFNVLQNIVKAWTAILKGDWKSALDYLKNAATSALDGIKNIFNTLKDTLKNIFSDIIDSMKTWGKDMIDNLVKGITEKIGAVKDGISKVAETIKEYIHFTEPDVGPLSDFHTYAPDMMREFSEGILASRGLLTSAVSEAFDLKPYIMSLDRSARTMATNMTPEAVSGGGINVNVVLQGDADRLFRVMSYEAQRNRQITGQSALAGI